MSKAPAVSILMPNRNMSPWIDQAINSVRTQTFEDWQLIVIDDGSSDDSPQQVARHCAEDPRIHLIQLPHSLGPRQARNHGTRVVQGRYVTFLDSDDYWLPHKLERQITMMRQRKAVLSYSAYQRIDERQQPNPTVHTIEVPDTITYDQLLLLNVISTATAMYDREQAGNMYNFHPWGTCDYALWLYLLRHYGAAQGIQEPLSVYRMRPDSVSSNKIRAATQRWLVYRHCERMNWFYSCFCFAIYAVRALQRDVPHRGLALGIGTKAP